MKQFEGKKILITGVCGSVGSELVRQLLTEPDFEPDEVIGLDNNETDLFFVDQTYERDSRARFFLVDICDGAELKRKMQGVDVVFHAAAYKHVILCERSPDQAVNTNIHGIQNVISAAIDNNVGMVVFTSSDKAVNPTSVMGTSKLMGERLMTAANSSQRKGGPIFTSTRFGNVLGSSGSVIPIFRNQIEKGGPVTLTDARMSRFVMSIEEAVRLVIDSSRLAQGGEVLITKMPVIRIKDLAKAMVEELASHFGHRPEDVSIEEIGAKPGEKFYEELMSSEETRRAVELEHYFSVLPAHRGINRQVLYDYPEIISKSVANSYISSEEEPLTLDQIRRFIRSGEFGSDI